MASLLHRERPFVKALLFVWLLHIGIHPLLLENWVCELLVLQKSWDEGLDVVLDTIQLLLSYFLVSFWGMVTRSFFPPVSGLLVYLRVIGLPLVIVIDTSSFVGLHSRWPQLVPLVFYVVINLLFQIKKWFEFWFVIISALYIDYRDVLYLLGHVSHLPYLLLVLGRFRPPCWQAAQVGPCLLDHFLEVIEDILLIWHVLTRRVLKCFQNANTRWLLLEGEMGITDGS